MSEDDAKRGREALQAAVSHAYPDRSPIEIAMEGGWRAHYTGSVRFADGETVYVKVAADGEPEPIARQVAASAYARANTEVRTPAVLAVDLEPGQGVLPYIVSSPIGGTPLDSAWEGSDSTRIRALLRTVGATISAIHVADFDEPGRIVGGNADALELASAPWPEVLADHVAAQHRYMPDRFSDAISAVRKAILEQDERLRIDEPTLVHDDPQPDNLYVEPTGAIDWENACVGDPALDILRAKYSYVDRPEIEQGERLWRELRDAYESACGAVPDGVDAHAEIYELVTFLRTLQTFERWAPDAPEPVPELEAWVRREFSDRLERAKG